MNKEIIDVISEYENYNLFTCLNKIESIEKSLLFKDLSILEKFFLLVYEVCSYDQLLFPEEVKSRLSKVNKLLPEQNFSLDDVSKFIFLTLTIWKLINTNNDIEIDKEIAIAEKLRISLFERSNNESDILDLKLICLYYLVLSMYYMKENTWEKAYSYIQDYRNLADETKTSIIIYDSYNVLIHYYFLRKDLHSEMNQNIRRINYFESKNDLVFICLCYIMDAYFYYNGLGDLKTALSLNDKAQLILKNLAFDTENALTVHYHAFTNRGKILLLMGKYDEAINAFNTALQYAITISDTYKFAIFVMSQYNNFSQVYSESGDYQTALEYQNKAQTIRKIKDHSLGNFTFRNLFNLVFLNLKVGNLKEAQNNFEILEYQFQNNKGFNYFNNLQNAYIITKALLLIEEKTMKTTVEAQELLQTIVVESNLTTPDILEALLPLIDLTIQEYKIYQKQEVFESIESFISRLRELAEIMNSIPIKIRLLIVLGKLDLILGKHSSFEKLFSEAKRLASEYDLKAYEELIDEESKKSEISKWKSLLINNASLAERLDIVNLANYVRDASTLLNKQNH